MTGFNENSFGQITLVENAFEAEGPSWLSHSAQFRFPEESNLHVFEEYGGLALGAGGALFADVLKGGVPPLSFLKKLTSTGVYVGVSGGVAVAHIIADNVTNALGLLTEHQVVEV